MKSPPIPDDEKLFDIPSTWTWCRLGEIAEIITGATPSTKHREYFNGNVPFVKPADIGSSDFITATHETLTRVGAATVRIIPRDAVCVCCIGSVGKTAIATQECCTNQQINSVIPLGVDGKYLYYAIQSNCFQTKLRDVATVVTIALVNKSSMSNIPIPLPPLAEQKRIVAALEGMLKAADVVATGMEKIAALKDRARAKILDLAIRGKLVEQDAADEPAEKLLARIRRGEMSATLTQRTQSSQRGAKTSDGIESGEAASEKLCDSLSPLRSLCQPPQGDDDLCLRRLTQRTLRSQRNTKCFAPITDDEKPFAIPPTWIWCRLGEIALQISKGTTPHGGNDSYVPQGISFLRAENVGNDGRLHLKSLKHITADVHEHELSRSVLAAGDLLITIAGSLGHAAIVDAGILPANTNQAVSFVRLADLNSISVKYILLAIQSPVIQEMMLSKKKVTGVPNLTLEIISNLPIPLPPLAEQKRIVAKADEMLAACDALELGRGER